MCRHQDACLRKHLLAQLYVARLSSFFVILDSHSDFIGIRCWQILLCSLFKRSTSLSMEKNVTTMQHSLFYFRPKRWDFDCLRWTNCFSFKHGACYDRSYFNIFKPFCIDSRRAIPSNLAMRPCPRSVTYIIFIMF